MSVFQLVADANARIDSRYINSLDVVIQNPGSRVYEALMIGYCGDDKIHLSLNQIKTVPLVYSTININDVRTSYLPFRLEVITNINQPDSTAMVVYAKNEGNLVAVFTEQDFVLLDQ
ncbi:hypothetical protein NST83_19190 [Paenibacillus sp. FSL R10-2782]|uniref:hypothetical protein n=1 Tax=Paenibacillus sp. FSL R10-2782 TaxID=2954661 RepID=UPI003159345E